ncbi:15-hydroxyprostaglandin dehydrogenase [Trichonephila clavipes]|nr:15-hydroxyprostaglandin dehydrogenase [Trichonephila clavipes]
MCNDTNTGRLQWHVEPFPAAIHAATRSGIELIRPLCCPEADGSTNLEQPTLNHFQSDTMASAILADPTRSLQGTNRGSRPAMKESENDVRSLEQLLLYVDEHYFAGKLLLGNHLGKVLHGIEEYTIFCQSVTFHIDLAWHHCRRSCRCSNVNPLSGYLPPEKLFQKRFTLILLLPSKMQRTSILSPF